MTYLFQIPVLVGTSYSLFIVGTASLLGAWRYHRRRLLDYRIALAFMIPSLFGLHATRRWLIPVLPDPIVSLGTWQLSKSQFIMLTFAIVMLAASVTMIHPTRLPSEQHAHRPHLFLLLATGVVVGFIAGLVGAGGGFLIIPALVVFAKIPMQNAIGTSLLVIAINSLLGFLGDVSSSGIPDWSLLITVSTLALIGVMVGSLVGEHVSTARLKPLFGWFVLMMGLIILVTATTETS